MDLRTMLFLGAIAIVFWFGIVRNIITIIIGESQAGPLKPGQILCHLTSILLHFTARGFAFYYHIFWPLAVGWIVESSFRKFIVMSGDIAAIEQGDEELR